MKKIAVILSGCGVFDGSEIHESVLTLLALSRSGVEYQCLAPNIAQRRVVNHLTGEEVSNETRNVLVEAARIARGKITDIANANPDDFDAMILPGGFGAATNLCDFALSGASCQVEPSVLKFTQTMAKAKKVAGFICIAPSLIAKIYGSGIKMTIGNDPDTIKTLAAMGNQHIECTVDSCIVDNDYKVVSTPAYMLGNNIAEVAQGIEKLVAEVLKLA